MPILRFGIFEVDSTAGELRKRGFRLRLREQPLRLLLTLLSVAGRVVTREQLRQELWPDGTFVEFDRAINKAVSELRAVLGDSASSSRFVETLPKRGYRFVGPVEEIRTRTQPSTRRTSIVMDGWRTSPGGISGIEERSPICIRASVYLSKPWIPKVMVGLRTRDWRTQM